MGEPNLPRNRDQDIPPRTGDSIGTREPIAPQPTPEPNERHPLPEEETYERDHDKKRPDKKRPDEEKPLVEHP
jgi:hypothetical protein